MPVSRHFRFGELPTGYGWFIPERDCGSALVDFQMTDLAVNFDEETAFKLDVQWPDYPKERSPMQFTIESGVPIPKIQTRLCGEFQDQLREAIQKLEPGQSILAPLPETGNVTAAKLQMSAMTFARNLKPKQFISRKVHGEGKKEIGIRIWRLE